MSRKSSGLLLIRLLSASDLIAGDLGGSSDPYVRFKIPNNPAVTSRVIATNLNPVWNEDFVFFLKENKGKILLEIWDRDAVGKDDFLGKCEFDLEGLNHFKTVSMEKKLEGVKSGSVKFNVRLLTMDNTLSQEVNEQLQGLTLDEYGFPISKPESYAKASIYKDQYPSNLSGGIPFHHKPHFWKQSILDLMQVKSHPIEDGLLEKLLPMEINQVMDEQIEKDIPRTFPLHAFFQSEEGKNSLRRVCRAFTIKNPHIGYCQSMNFIIGALLLQMEEEDAFKHFCLIVENMYPGYYSRTMEGLQVDHLVLQQLVNDKLPKLAKHMESLHMDISILATRWLMCLFLNTLPFHTVGRMWDLIFTKGSAYSVLISYALLKANESELLKKEDFMEFSKYFDTVCESTYNWKNIISELDSLTAPTASTVEALRKKFEPEVTERIRERQMQELKKTHFSMEELELIRDDFIKLSTKGVVTIDEFDKLLENISIRSGGDIKDPEVRKKIFNYFDTNKDGTIDFKEFCVGLSSKSKGTPKEKVTFCFKIFDKNGDETLNQEELEEMLKFYYKATGVKDFESVAKFYAAETFDKYDQDKSGTLSFGEMESALESQPILQQLLRSI